MRHLTNTLQFIEGKFMFLDKYRHYVLGLLRIVLGYAFVLHGTAKFWEFPMSMTGGNGSVELASLMGWVV